MPAQPTAQSRRSVCEPGGRPSPCPTQCPHSICPIPAAHQPVSDLRVVPGITPLPGGALAPHREMRRAVPLPPALARPFPPCLLHPPCPQHTATYFRNSPGLPRVHHLPQQPPCSKTTQPAPNAASSGVLPTGNSAACSPLPEPVLSRQVPSPHLPGLGDSAVEPTSRRAGGQQGLRGGRGTPRTFVNEAHILLMGRGEDLTAGGGRAGATVPLAVVDDSGDRGAVGAREGTLGAGWDPTPLPWAGHHSAAQDPPGHRWGVWSSCRTADPLGL